MRQEVRGHRERNAGRGPFTQASGGAGSRGPRPPEPEGEENASRRRADDPKRAPLGPPGLAAPRCSGSSHSAFQVRAPHLVHISGTAEPTSLFHAAACRRCQKTRAERLPGRARALLRVPVSIVVMVQNNNV